MTVDNREAIIDQVVRIVAQTAGMKPQEIRLDTRLLHDLHLFGGDIDDIIIAIERALKLKDEIDTAGFERYFFGEGPALWALSKRLFRRFASRLEPFTVGQLVDRVVDAASRSDLHRPM